MKNTINGKLMLTVVLLLIFSCAGEQPPAEAVAVQNQKTIEMKASSYKFEPNNIKANQGDSIVFNITNTSDTQHNFTIKDPGDKILQSVDLPPKKTTSVKVSFPEKGTYGFYCDKPFHPTLGMKGHVEVGQGL